MDDGRTFGQRLRATRIYRSHSQKSLAKAAGLPKTGHRTIADWETGRSIPRPGGRLPAVAAVLDTTPHWLLHGGSLFPEGDELNEAGEVIGPRSGFLPTDLSERLDRIEEMLAKLGGHLGAKLR